MTMWNTCTQARLANKPGFSCKSLKHTYSTIKVLSANCCKPTWVFSDWKATFWKQPFYSPPQETVHNLPLQTVRSLHQCTAEHWQKTTPNGTFSPKDFRTILKEPRPFFSPTAMSTLFQRCYLCFCAPAIAPLLLRTSEHPDRQPENPVTEGTFTRQRILGRWLVSFTSAQHSALSSLDQTGMVHSLLLVKFLKLLCK